MVGLFGMLGTSPLDVDPPWVVPVYGFPGKSLLPASKTETQAYFLAVVMAAVWPSCSGPYTYIPSLVALLETLQCTF